MGWEKVACWSTKVAISLKRVKIEERLLWRAYRNSPTLFRTVQSPTPYGLLFPKIGGSQLPPKIPIAIISGMGTATNSNFVCIFTWSIETKDPFEISCVGLLMVTGWLCSVTENLSVAVPEIIFRSWTELISLLIILLSFLLLGRPRPSFQIGSGWNLAWFFLK